MNNGDRKRVHCHVAGRVQGVWYRKSAQEAAQRLGVSGWVRNLPDGRVELVAEGPTLAVEELLLWLAQGPPGAQVGDVKIETEKPTARNGGFEILY